MKQRKPALFLALAMLALTSFGGAATAQTDQVVHPNSSCRWTEDWTHRFPTQVASYYYDGIYHTDTSTSHSLLCGIDRFNLTNTTGLRDLDVRLYNAADPQGVRCFANSMRPDGSLVKSVMTEVEPFEYAKRLDFNGALDMSVSYGAYSVDCRLPAYMKINNILQREY